MSEKSLDLLFTKAPAQGSWSTELVTATMDTQPNQPKVQHCQLNQSIII
jgi:hypothetical protein